MAGDFNEIAYPWEKKIGARVNVQKCNAFKSHIEEWGLMDEDMKGPQFT